MKNKLLTLAFLAVTMMFGMGNEGCDEGPGMIDSSNAAAAKPGPQSIYGNPNDPTQPADPGAKNSSGTDASRSAEGSGNTGGQTGVACQSTGDCGSGMTCVSGQCEAEAALIVSMTWTDNSDFDLHLVQPNGEEVYYRNRNTDAGAKFVQDSCVGDRCEEGAERKEAIRFEGYAPGGEYRIFVVNYDGKAGGSATIEVVKDGQTETFTANLGASEGAKSQEFKFTVETMDAPCMINVAGYGMVDFESDYLPNVLACESAAGTTGEALKAQAIEARGYAYALYKNQRVRTFKNNQSHQVYKCDYRPNGAQAEHFAAVRATTGKYLTWEGTVVTPMFVAGAIPKSPNSGDAATACRGTGGRDQLNTEHFVTYNYGKFGCDIKMSTQGLTTSDCRRNKSNRGSASQNGQKCLSNRGWNAQQIVEYYYGADIELQQTDMCFSN